MYESYINKIEVVAKLRNLKPGTIRTYQKNVSDFLKFMDKNPEDLTCEDARGILFPSQLNGDYLTTSGPQLMFRKSVKKAGLPKDIHPQQHRHTFTFR